MAAVSIPRTFPLISSSWWSVRRPLRAADECFTKAIILPFLNWNPMYPMLSLCIVTVRSSGLQRNRYYTRRGISDSFWQEKQTHFLHIHEPYHLAYLTCRARPPLSHWCSRYGKVCGLGPSCTRRRTSRWCSGFDRRSVIRPSPPASSDSRGTRRCRCSRSAPWHRLCRLHPYTVSATKEEKERWNICCNCNASYVKYVCVFIYNLICQYKICSFRAQQASGRYLSDPVRHVGLLQSLRLPR